MIAIARTTSAAGLFAFILSQAAGGLSSAEVSVPDKQSNPAIGTAANPAARPEVQRPRDTDSDPSRALPFAFTVKNVAWGGIGKTDFPQPFFRIEDQLAHIFGVQGNQSLRTGPDMDRLQAATSGAGTFTFDLAKPRTDNMCISGGWYDRETKTLYAVIHCEIYNGVQRGVHATSAGWPRKKTALAKSTDLGKTWQAAGDLLTAPYQDNVYDVVMYSGADYEPGPADFELYVDERGGYFYLTCWNTFLPKNGGLNGFLMGSEVARCAIADKMAPGKWFKYRDGAWTEPGLGGKASRVRFDRRGLYGSTIYSTFLKRYLRIGVHVGTKDDRGMPGYGFNDRSIYISTCTDLGKQDWSPMAKLLDDPACKPIIAAFTLTDATGSDPYTCGDTLRIYNYWEHAARRLDVTFKEGTTPSVYFPPHDSYGYQPHPESGDPIESRRTRIVGAASPEMRYAGAAWKGVAGGQYYQGLVMASETAGSTVEFTFTGADIYWRAVADKDGGRADVFIDDKLEQTVDCYFWDCELPYQFAFIKTGLDPKKTHTIKVVVRGDKNPASSGTLIRHMAFEPAAEFWQASRDFCSIQGKNQWSYQSRTPDGTFADMKHLVPVKDEWASAHEGRIGYAHQIPDRNSTARTWVAPRDGTVRVQGSVGIRDRNVVQWDPSILYVDTAGADVMPPPSKDGAVRVSLLLNDKPLFTCNPANGSPVAHDVHTAVKRGDKLHFLADYASREPLGAAVNPNAIGTMKMDQQQPGISLSWQPPAAGYPQNFRHFNIERDDGMVLTSGSPAVADVNVVAPGFHIYRISAVNLAGIEGPKTAVTAAVWDQPFVASTGPVKAPVVAATVQDERTIALTWKPSPDLAAGVGGYVVYRDGARIGLVTGTDFTDVLGLRPATAYTYQVTGVDQGYREGEPSQPVKVTTPADTRPPKVLHVSTPSVTNVAVIFDEAPDPVTAVAASSYALSDGLGVAKAEMAGDRLVVLTTQTPMVNGKTCTLTVQSVRDRNQPPNAMDKPVAVPFTVATEPTLLSQGRPIAASSSGMALGAANDGDPKTRWSSIQKPGQPHWVQIDLQQVRLITRIVLRWESGGVHEVLLSDDGKTWKQVSTARQSTQEGEEHTLCAAARFVRLDCKPGGHGNSSLWEFQIFGPRN